MYNSMNREMSSFHDEVVIDVDKDWLINTKEDPEPNIECCIYRVPKRIRKVNEEAYTPQIVSIGPFHREELKAMEKQKRRYIREFSKRTTHEKRVQVRAFVENSEQKIRSCYSEKCELQGEDYIRMILHDAIFIIELFLRDYEDNDYDEDDDMNKLLAIQAERSVLSTDLRLLENQLPYFLLEGIYKLVVSSPSFIILCRHFFYGPDRIFHNVPPDKTKFKHFTDWERTTLVSNYQKQKYRRHEDVNLPCASKLRGSGVKFKLALEMESLLDIRFDGRELRIPQLRVFGSTETYISERNGFEQCHHPLSTPFCDYVGLLGSLIDDKSDLDLLVKEGIISIRTGDSTAIVSMFKKLCTQIRLNRVYYRDISKELAKHYGDPVHSALGKLKSVYFPMSGQVQQL